jgi:hypothetical protein
VSLGVADAAAQVASDAGVPGSADGGAIGGGGGSSGAADAGGTSAADGGGSGKTNKLYGFTLDSVTDIANIVDSLAKLPKRALVRIVFDYPEDPPAYADAVTKISAVADIVGQPSDSFYSAKLTVSQYRARFESYVSAFPSIGLWEACNECNGAWGGPNTAAQAEAAFDVIKAHGKRVLFTPYWNTPSCADANGDYLQWTDQQISTKLKQGTDLVAVSIYGMDCTGNEPSYAELDAMFSRLSTIFPNAQLGIGEYGASKAADK